MSAPAETTYTPGLAALRGKELSDAIAVLSAELDHCKAVLRAYALASCAGKKIVIGPATITIVEPSSAPAEAAEQWPGLFEPGLAAKVLPGKAEALCSAMLGAGLDPRDWLSLAESATPKPGLLSRLAQLEPEQRAEVASLLPAPRVGWRR